MDLAALRFPPTTKDLLDDGRRPYFLWWTDVTGAQFRQLLQQGEPSERAYWLGALLREANTRDVWLFAQPDELRQLWPYLIRHLGRSRAMWAYLLGLPEPVWPPPEARDAQRLR